MAMTMITGMTMPMAITITTTITTHTHDHGHEHAHDHKHGHDHDHGPLSVDAVWAEAPLLLWLSPAFPVGAYAYSHGIEWAYEAGDVDRRADARRVARGSWPLSARRVSTRSCSPRPSRRLGAGLGRARRAQHARRRARRLGRTAAGDNGAGRSLPPRGARRLGQRAACPCARARGRTARLSGRRRRRRGRPRHGAGARREAYASRNSPIWSPPRRGSASSARPTGRRFWPGWRPTLPRWRAKRRALRSTIWAPAHFAPTSPLCGTKPNIRGCSAHELLTNRYASASAARSAPAKRR